MKVNLKIKIKGEEKVDTTVTGIKIDNTIKYLENDMTVLITYNNDKLTLKRSNSDYQLTLNFENGKETTSIYEFVGGSKKFELKTFTSNLLITDNKIFVKYNLEGNDFEFTLEVI